MSISFNNEYCISSVYLPTRSGCTDNFKESLDSLSVIAGKYIGKAIFLGDFNADPGGSMGFFSSTILNEQGRILVNFLKQWNYTSVHLCLNTPTNPTHTYETDSNNCLSTIDHIICHTSLLPSFISCSVVSSASTALNTSEHLPLFGEVSLSNVPHPSPQSSSTKRASLNWKKVPITLIEDSYASSLHAKLSSIEAPHVKDCLANSCLLESFIGEISDAILSTSRETIPVKSYQKHVCPGWTPELSNARRLSKSAWFRWKSAGKPSSATHPAKVEYKEAKRSFRHLLKQLHNEQRFRFYNDINENLKDADRLFGLLRAHAGTQPILANSILVDGREFCSDDIHATWVGELL